MTGKTVVVLSVLFLFVDDKSVETNVTNC